MSPEEEKRRRRAQMIAEGALAGQTRFMEDTVRRIPKGAPKALRGVAKGAAGAPALVYDLANFARADDRWREAASIAGTALGGTIGGAMGGATGLAAPVAGPAGAAIGSAAGSDLATEAYDQNYARIRPYTKAVEAGWEDLVENGRRVADTKQWMAERAEQLLRSDPSFNRIRRLTGR